MRDPMRSVDEVAVPRHERFVADEEPPVPGDHCSMTNSRPLVSSAVVFRIMRSPRAHSRRPSPAPSRYGRRSGSSLIVVPSSKAMGIEAGSSRLDQGWQIWGHSVLDGSLRRWSFIVRPPAAASHVSRPSMGSGCFPASARLYPVGRVRKATKHARASTRDAEPQAPATLRSLASSRRASPSSSRSSPNVKSSGTPPSCPTIVAIAIRFG